ncbi:putative receptor protein kinase ZmPK1 [Hordeum vulgare]|nr:putative receptor protein kinase ZmPK1 [Hordeum vulgare]
MPSFDNETYMSTMGVGSNNSHWSQTNEVHGDDEMDEDGEGIIEAPKGRAGNYTTDEDILLCNTWLVVSMDTTVGGDQSRDTYWDRMKEYFDERNKSGIERTNRSLRSRWSTINKDYQRWEAEMKPVDKINPSGTNDREREKTKKGKVKEERAFVLPHCYEVLKDVEKWKGRDDQDDNKKSKATIDLDEEEEASSDDGKRNPTPNSVAYSNQEDQMEVRKKQNKRIRGEEMMS